MNCSRTLIAAWILLGAATAAWAVTSVTPDLTLTPDDTCYQVGATVTVNVDLSNASAAIVGGQFFLSYDKNKLTFVSADPSSVWTVQIFESVNVGAGTIDYAVGIPSGGGGAASGTMAVLTFTAAAEVCNSASLVSFRAHTPPTKITDENNTGYTAGTSLAVHDLPAISIDSTPPAATTAPGAGDADLECTDSAGLAAALAFAPGFSDDCTTSLGADLISDDTTPDGNGGYVRVRTWTATDDCGNTSDSYVQTIMVSGVCDDGNACTENDTCVDGECLGTPINCDDGNSCTVDTCVDGACFHDPLAGILGDVNVDGLVDGRDIQNFVAFVVGGGPPTPAYCAADMTGDGIVNMADVPGFVAVLMGA